MIIPTEIKSKLSNWKSLFKLNIYRGSIDTIKNSAATDQIAIAGGSGILYHISFNMQLKHVFLSLIVCWHAYIIYKTILTISFF